MNLAFFHQLVDSQGSLKALDWVNPGSESLFSSMIQQ